MSGFIRRYGFNPDLPTITLIEGVIIADLPPPGSIQGVGSGVVCVVGEFSNMAYAVTVDSTGNVTTNPRPVEVLSSIDMVDKVGGWDETLGKFGSDQGNGFVEIRNKTFRRLICAPVDLITPSSTGTTGALRIYRELPTNQSATVAQPIVPVSPASVPAGREFRSSGNRVRLASNTIFQGLPQYAMGIDGAITAAAAAVTNTFTSASGNFVNAGVAVGDALVLGVIGGAGALGANAGTYRVVSITNATTLVVQKLDGSSWAWTTGTAQPWRLHKASTFDSAPVAAALATNLGYSVVARPLDATVAAATQITPTIVPPAGTAVSWDILSGLSAWTHPTAALTYDAAIHAPNVASSATLDARYQSAIDGILSDDAPARDINIVVAARKTSTIRSKLKSHVLTASQRGLTRRAVISPAVNQVTFNAVIGDTDPGVGANRSDRIDYSWPGALTSVPEAVGFAITTADGKTTTDGILDTTGDTWLAAVESALAPERNPGQAAPPVPGVLAPVIGFSRGTPKLAMPEYTLMRQFGIAGLRFDRVSGPIFQSGITSSLVSGEKNISRRRMADFIQDSIAQALNPLCKLPLTPELRDTIVGEISAFLTQLQAPDQPSARRIESFLIDDKSGNTPQTLAAGVFVVIVKVRLTPTADFIVLQTDVSENTVTVQAA